MAIDHEQRLIGAFVTDSAAKTSTFESRCHRTLLPGIGRFPVR
jgi:hypothetical protein